MHLFSRSSGQAQKKAEQTSVDDPNEGKGMFRERERQRDTNLSQNEKEKGG